MKLKQIILHGFKSFADRTVFDIHAGVSCVVGPNGCGKSNIVESVRWVLGEQSIKQLRGTDRTDVIFQGSSSRKALNLAEVSLVFDNSSRKLNYPADEVTVSRRLYRNGESQYLINKNQCLLRNIRELFLDTGVGTSSYSIIQQGRVKALLEANGKERRNVFEEAAGIGKYMVHRGRTMRTLERIQNRLDAFRGILTDARKQYKSALKQAERTLEAEAIRKQLESQQKVLYLIQYSDATEQLGQLAENLTQLESELHTSDERRAQLAEQEAQTQQQRAESTNRSYAAKSRSIEMEGQIARLQSESMSQKAMADSEEKLSIQTALRAEELVKQSGEARLQAEQARAELSAAESERQPQAQRCAEYARDLNAARAEQQRLAQAEETAANDYNRTQQDRARTGAEQSAVAARLEANRAARTQAEQALTGLQADLERLEKQAADLTAECAVEQTAADAKQAEYEALVRARQALEERRRDLTARQEAWREESAHTQARRQTAEQFLAAELRKADSPARIAEKLQTATGGAAGAQALVDLIQVEAGWAAAVEIALGEFARAVAVLDGAAVQKAMAQPVAAGAFLISRLAAAEEPARGPAAQAHPTFTSPAAKVSCGEELRPLVDWLFGGVALCETLTPAAVEAAKAAGLHTLVDRHGTVWKNGLYRAAASFATSATGATISSAAAAEPDLSTLGVLGLRTEIERLGVRLTELQGRKAELAIEAEALAGEFTRHETEREAAQRAWSDLKSRVEWLARQRDAARRDRDQAAQQVARRREEITALGERVTADEARAVELETRHAELTATLTELDRQLAALREARRATAEKLHTLGETYREAQALLSRLEQICESRRMESESAARRADRLEVETKAVQESAATHRANAEAGWKQAEQSRVKAEELVAEAAACKSQAEELEKAVNELSAALAAISSEKHGLEDRLRQARDTFSRLQLDHQRVRMERDAILEKAQAEFRVDLAAVLKKRETPLPTVSDEDNLEGATTADAGNGSPVAAAAADGLPGDEASAAAAADLAEAQAVQADVAAELSDVAQAAGLAADGTAAAAPGEHTEITVPKEVDPFEAATLDLEMIPVIRERINKLRESLDAFGEINWNALQLKREAELRVQFLEEQFTDLETARDRLRDILATINRKSRELFINCFNDVRTRFGGMFRKLFGGGQAEIFLEQNVDVLEAGIEIVAKPPGKEPQHLSQLSGGEKTMTTIGLLMSIYQIKPSPFCIMDEIDADLDGPNVDRLNLTIKEFLDRSQFLIISHRPRTMTYADVLYGISMNMVGPDSGVSKRVSIAFEEIEQQYGSEDLPDSAKAANNAGEGGAAQAAG